MQLRKKVVQNEHSYNAVIHNKIHDDDHFRVIIQGPNRDH